MKKRQTSLDTFFGKRRRRLDLEDIKPTADAADESNVDDRRPTECKWSCRSCNQRQSRRRADRHLRYYSLSTLATIVADFGDNMSPTSLSGDDFLLDSCDFLLGSALAGGLSTSVSGSANLTSRRPRFALLPRPGEAEFPMAES